MTTFYYIKARHQPGAFVSRVLTSLGWGLGPKPHLFTDRREAFNAYERFRIEMKMAGKPTTLMEIKEVDL